MAKATHGPSKTSARSVEIAQRRKECLRLREAYLSYPQIAERLGISASQAYQDVAYEIRRIPQEAADSLRAMETRSLDELEGRAWIALKGGRMPCPECGAPVPLPARLSALDRILRVKERRARMLGLDKAPEAWSVDEVRVIVKQIGVHILQVVGDAQERQAIAARLRELKLGDDGGKERQLLAEDGNGRKSGENGQSNGYKADTRGA